MTDLYRVLVKQTGENGEEVLASHMRATQTEALADAGQFRKLGISSTVSKVTLKKLPLKEMLSHLFNQEFDEFTEAETVIKEVAGVKHPKPVEE